MKEITTEAVTSSIDAITDFVNAELETLGCPMRTQMQIDVVIDEIISNISYYAYAPGKGNVTVSVEAQESPRAVVIRFQDSGTPYDPLSVKEPDVTLSAEKRKLGGLGIFIVRKTMDDVSYEHRDGKNVLRVLKYY